MTMLALQQHQHQDDLTSHDACSLVALPSPLCCSRKRTTTQVMLSALPRWEASARSVLAACSESRIGFTMATASCQHSSEARHLEEQMMNESVVSSRVYLVGHHVPEAITCKDEELEGAVHHLLLHKQRSSVNRFQRALLYPLVSY